MVKTVFWILTIALQATALPAWTQSTPYPSRPVRLVVPFPPGGSTDVMARLVAQKLTERWGRAIVVENKPGGGTLIGTDFVAKASADGYTALFTAGGAIAVLPHTHKKLPYDPFKDFIHVVQVCDLPFLLVVHPSVKAKSLNDLLIFARANPGRLTYASAGQGGPGHLIGEMLKAAAGVDLTHIAYKGAGPATNDLLGGQVDTMFTALAGALPYIKAGRLRALGVTGAHRSPGLPDVPTIAEAGVKDFEYTGNNGFSIPRATPPAIAAKLNADIRAVVAMPDVAKNMIAQGMEPRTGTSDEYTTLLRKEWEKNKNLIERIGFKAE